MLVILLLVAVPAVGAGTAAADSADKTVQLRVEGSCQTLFDDTVAVASSGEAQTALDALEQALAEAGIDCEIQDSDMGKFIHSIDNEAAGKFGGWDGWMYLYNGEMADVGVAECLIEDGDELVFYYGNFPPDTLIPEITVSPTEPQSNEAITIAISSSYYDWMTSETVTVAVAGANVSCDGQVFTTDEEGIAVITGLAPGSYTLLVSKDIADGCPALVRSAPIALTVSEAEQDPLQQGIDNAIGFLIAQQGEDGKLGASLAWALHQAGLDISKITVNGKSDLDYLQQRLQDDYAGSINTTSQLALAVMEIVAGGGDPTDFADHNLIQELIALQDDNGHFGAESEQQYITTQYWAIMALHAAGVAIPDAESVKQWLLNNASINGGWSWGVDQAPSPDMTAYIIRTLLFLGESPDSPAITAGKQYLNTHLQNDGGFDDGWTSDSNVWTTAEVLKALVELDIDPTTGDWAINGNNPVLYLLSQQKDSGEIGNPAGTAEGLIALQMFKAKYGGDDTGSGTPNNGGSSDTGNGGGTSDSITVNIAVVGPGQEILFKPGPVSITKKGRFGLTVMEALEATDLGWTFSTEFEGFVVAVAGHQNEGMNGWCYSLNGKAGTVLALEQKVSSGDKVIWWYSTDAMGAGPSWNELQKSSASGTAGGGAATALKPADEVKDDLQQYAVQLDAALAQMPGDGNNTLQVLNADKKMTPVEATALQKELDKNKVAWEQQVGTEETLLADKEIALLIPRGALKKETKLTVKELGSWEKPCQYAIRPASPVYEFGPDGLAFVKPATIAITLALTEDTDLTDLVPAWYDEESSQWIPLAAVIDLETGQVIFRVDHFTDFAIIEQPPRNSFADLQGYGWAQEAIEILAGQNIVAGTGAGFEPGRNITRAEFVQLMVKAAGLKANPGQNAQFTDVKIGDWFEPAIGVACSHQLTAGYADGSFRPGQTINRYEAALILHNTDNSKTLNGAAEISCADSADIPAWAVDGVKYVQTSGLMKGYTDGSFGGSRPLTRAEAAVTIYRYLSARPAG